MPFICPFCASKNRRVEHQRIGDSINHIYLKHNDGFKLGILSILIALMIAVVGVLIGVYNQDIRLWIDDNWGENPDMYFSISIYYPFNDTSSYLMNGYLIEELLIDKQKEIGIIPKNADKNPIIWNFDEGKHQSCLFWAFDMADKVPQEQVPEDIRNKSQSWITFSFAFPNSDFYSLIRECSNRFECLGYVFYGVNTGNRTIDLLDMKICLKSEDKILYSNYAIRYDGDNCIRFNQKNIPTKDKAMVSEVEKEMGYIIVKKNENVTQEDFWGDDVFKINEGKFTSLRKEIPINKTSATRIIFGYVPSCRKD